MKEIKNVKSAVCTIIWMDQLKNYYNIVHGSVVNIQPKLSECSLLARTSFASIKAYDLDLVCLL